MATLNPDLGLYLQPRLYTYINGVYVPGAKIQVVQSAYNVTDTATIDTPLSFLPFDFGKMAQQLAESPAKTTPYVVRAGVASNNSPTNPQSFPVIFNGFLDEQDSNYETDIATFKARGVLSLLVDRNVTLRLNMNSPIDKVVSSLISLVPGLTPVFVNTIGYQSGADGTQLGNFLNSDYLALGRNVKAMNLITTILNRVGWTMKVVNTTVYFGGLYQDKPYIITKNWKQNAGMSCQVQHSALHSHHIRVKVISYIQKTKATNTSTLDGTDQQALLSAAWALEGLPGEAVIPSKATTKSTVPSGRQAGVTTVGGDNPNNEEYVYYYPNLTKAQCDVLAEQIRDRISSHEFTIDFKWTPTADEISKLASYGPTVVLAITGLSQPSHNGYYYPRTITWDYDSGESGSTSGLELALSGVNHPVPTQDIAGGEANQDTLDNNAPGT